MRTFLILKKENLRSIPEAFQTDDNRFPEALVSYFLNNYTQPGDSVLDIFAGLETTLFVAEQMKRIAYGLEYDKKRVDYIRANLVQKNNVIHGDALKLEDYQLPKMDFCLTSPPYMPKDDNLNPLTGCTTKGDYKRYLKDIRTIFSKVKDIMKANSYVVIEVANLKENGVTTLAWDIAREVSKTFHFEGEIVIGWEQEGDLAQDGAYGGGYDHSYCLVFRKIN
ncbi:MAG: DNA methyltransferase [Candidatus Thorarchaeota archaeon]